MAKLPEYEMSVGLSNRQATPYLRDASTPQAFGAGFAQAVGKIGSQISEMVDAQRKLDATFDATDKELKYGVESDQLQAKFKNDLQALQPKEGEAYADAVARLRGNFEKDMEASRTKWGSSLSDSLARKNFDVRTRLQTQAALKNALTASESQIDNWQEGTAKAQANAAVRRMGNVTGDIKQDLENLQTQAGTGFRPLEVYLASHGHSPDEIQEIRKKLEVAGVVNALEGYGTNSRAGLAFLQSKLPGTNVSVGFVPPPTFPVPPGGTPHDLSKPILHNADGSISTEKTITIEADGKHVVLPTIVNGKEYTPDKAVELWRAGQNRAVGEFATAAEANAYAQQRHEEEAVLRSQPESVLSGDETRAWVKRLSDTGKAVEVERKGQAVWDAVAGSATGPRFDESVARAAFEKLPPDVRAEVEHDFDHRITIARRLQDEKDRQATSRLVDAARAGRYSETSDDFRSLDDEGRSRVRAARDAFVRQHRSDRVSARDEQRQINAKAAGDVLDLSVEERAALTDEEINSRFSGVDSKGLLQVKKMRAAAKAVVEKGQVATHAEFSDRVKNIAKRLGESKGQAFREQMNEWFAEGQHTDKEMREILGRKLLKLDIPWGRDKYAFEVSEEEAAKYKPVAVQPFAEANAGPAKISNDAEYNALPSGTMFVGPDGKQRRKP